jgi:hypothetical protein
MLGRNKFLSARNIAMKGKFPLTTTRRWLKKMNYKRLKVIVTRYPMTIGQQETRFEVSNILLKELKLLSPMDVITSDESWFFLDYQHDWMWVKEKNDVMEVERRKLYPKKFLVCIFWNFYDLLYIYVLDTGARYNSVLVVDELFPGLEEVALKHRPKRGLKSYSLHWDNARPHKSVMTKDEAERRFSKLLPHPAYSPELAPSDFFLFGYLKDKLRGKQIFDRDGLEIEIELAFKTIKKETKKQVFDEWLKRLGNVDTD